MSREHLIACAVIVLGGFIGGCANGLSNEQRFRRTLFGFSFELPVLKDIFAGVAAAFLVILIIPEFVTYTFINYLKLFALCILAGFGGLRFISKMSDKYLDSRIAKAAEEAASGMMEKAQSKSQVLSSFLDKAKVFRTEGKLEQALANYDYVMAQDPENQLAMIGRGMALKRLDRLKEAWEQIDSLVKTFPENPTGWYNRACYGALLGNESKSVAADLKKAIKLFPGYRVSAKDDADLNSVKSFPEIEALLK